VDIGKEKRRIVVEPLEEPVPGRERQPAPTPEPREVPAREPAKEPVKV